MTSSFDIDFTRVEQSPAIVEFLQNFGAAWLAEAQRLAQVRIKSQTGEYNRSFRVDLIGGRPPSLRLGNVSPHAIYVEDDTVAHTVEPTPKGRKSFTNPDRPGSLHWFAGAKAGIGPKNSIFAMKANIPAMRGRHIIKDAVTAAADNL